MSKVEDLMIFHVCTHMAFVVASNMHVYSRFHGTNGKVDHLPNPRVWTRDPQKQESKRLVIRFACNLQSYINSKCGKVSIVWPLDARREKKQKF